MVTLYVLEMESSRTFLASRTHSDVFGLEASSPRKLPCPRLEDSTIFELLKVYLAPEEFFGKVFFWRSPKNFFWKTYFCFWRALALVSFVLVLGLEHFCPWPREGLSSVGLSLALASSLLSLTPPLVRRLLCSANLSAWCLVLTAAVRSKSVWSWQQWSSVWLYDLVTKFYFLMTSS